MSGILYAEAECAFYLRVEENERALMDDLGERSGMCGGMVDGIVPFTDDSVTNRDGEERDDTIAYFTCLQCGAQHTEDET